MQVCIVFKKGQNCLPGLVGQGFGTIQKALEPGDKSSRTRRQNL
jgi:hypothetical protein